MATSVEEYARTTPPTPASGATKAFNVGWLAAFGVGAYLLFRNKDPLDPGSFEGLGALKLTAAERKKMSKWMRQKSDETTAQKRARLEKFIVWKRGEVARHAAERRRLGKRKTFRFGKLPKGTKAYRFSGKVSYISHSPQRVAAYLKWKLSCPGAGTIYCATRAIAKEQMNSGRRRGKNCRIEQLGPKGRS